MLLRRFALLAVTFAVAALALPALASAKDYCFGDIPGCTSNGYDESKLDLALAEAESNGTADRFFLAPPAQFNKPAGYQSSEPVEIIGAGRDKTVLSSDVAGAVLTLGGNKNSSVRGLTIKPVGSATVGLRLAGSDAHDVAVDAASAPALLAGVIASDGAGFSAGSIDIGSAAMPAFVVLDGSAAVSGSRLVAPKGYGVSSLGSDATVRRSTLDAKFGASASSGHLAVSDSLIDLRGKGSNATGRAVGVTAFPESSPGTAEADLDRVTIVGSTPGTIDAIGVSAGANGVAQSATIHMRDSVISGIGLPLARQGLNGATVNVSTDRSLYPQPVFPLNDGTGSLIEEHRLSGNPGFVDEAGGDFHLAIGSPLIDAGGPGPLPSGTADLDGNPRPSDGNGDGIAVTDVGAFEFRGGAAGPAAGSGTGATPPSGAPAPPVLSGLKVSPRRLAIGTPLPRLLPATNKRRARTIGFSLTRAARVEFRFTRLTADGKTKRIRTRVRIRARRGANRVRFAARLSRRVRLRAGAYRVTAIAVDSAGSRSKPATTRFTVIQPRRR
jgi:hypothetical protein